MKKIILFVLTVLSFYAGRSQNIFPDSGKTGIGTNTPLYNLDVIDNSSVVYAPGVSTAAIPAGTAVHISNREAANSKGAFIYLVSANSAPYNQVAYVGVVSVPGATHSPDFVIGQRAVNGSGYLERLRIASSGNVGIGITPGAAKFEVGGLVQTSGILGGFRFNERQGTGHDYQWYASNGNAFLYDHNDAANRMAITSNGNVGIGTNYPGAYKLAVEGIIGARKVKVTQNAWADFVFRPDYELPPLYEWEKFIIEKGHLPGMPNEKEVKENGLDLGEMNKKLLQKVEELTLHLINQQKINDLQSKRI
ncbi:MAG: hypothetical protein ACTHLD_16115, partial [Chitinophaga sp.]